MLSARKLFVPISLLSGFAVPCMVLYNTYEGNSKRWNPYTWDEPLEYDSVEIVDVFTEEEPRKSVLECMTKDEENYLQDLIVAVLEDEKC